MRFGVAGWRNTDWRRLQKLALATALFAIVVLVVPVKAVAIPGYLVLWIACLLGSWMLMGSDDGR